MQDVLAILIVAIALGYLARRAWLRFAGRQGACGSCSKGCTGDSLKSTPLVSITPLMSHAKAQRRKEISD